MAEGCTKKGNGFKSEVRAVMIYGNETLPMKKALKKKLHVTEMPMLS